MVSHKATFSVAMCTRNGERFVADQVRSILRQTVTPMEIVVSDDASTDSTLSIVRSLLAEHNAARSSDAVALVVLENPKPLGVAKNFEQALHNCTADFIALCDQDDVWRADKLERVSMVFRSDSRLMLVHSDARLTDGQGRPSGGTLLQALELDATAQALIHEGRALDLLLQRNVVTGATTVIRRALWARAAPVPPGWIHDEWLAIVAACHGGLALIPEPLIDYRQHGGNAIGAGKLSMLGKFRRLTEPGRARNERLYTRAHALRERFAENDDVPRELVWLAEQKLAHESMRRYLSPRRVRRLIPVIRELRTGRYQRYGRGLLDAARDLLQPLTPDG